MPANSITEVRSGSRDKIRDKTFLTTQDGVEYELLNRVNAEELKLILRDLPFFDVKNKITYDDKNPDFPYRISVGRGTFGKVTLGRRENKEGGYDYFAIKKVATQTQIRKADAKREDVLTYTKGEVVLHYQLKKMNNLNNISIIESHVNVHKPKLRITSYEQVYQITPLAEFGNAENFLQLARQKQAGVSTKEMQALLVNFANTLISTLNTLNENNIYMRDLKLENVLVYKDRLALSDFGSAVYYGSNQKYETAPWSDTYFQPPFIFFIYDTKQEEDAIRDKWSLALTLLSLWGDETAEIISIFKQLAADYYLSENKELMRERYLLAIQKLGWVCRESSMPIHIQDIIVRTMDFTGTPLSLSELEQKHHVDLQGSAAMDADVQRVREKVKDTAEKTTSNFSRIMTTDKDGIPVQAKEEIKQAATFVDDYSEPCSVDDEPQLKEEAGPSIVGMLRYQVNNHEHWQQADGDTPYKVKLIRNYFSKSSETDPQKVCADLKQIITADTKLGILKHPNSDNCKEKALCQAICKLADDLNDPIGRRYIENIMDEITYTIDTSKPFK